MFAHANKPISPGSLTFQFFHKKADGSKGEPIPYHEDDSDGKLYAFGHEFGIERIVCANGDCAAHEVYVDESRTIEEDEVHEAYGLYLMQAKSYFAPDKGESWYVLMNTNFHDKGVMVSESVLVCNGDRLTTGQAFPAKEEALTHAVEYIEENELELIEGYEYQSNFTGTGIVNVGHYQWMREITPAELDRLEIICELVQEWSPPV